MVKVETQAEKQMGLRVDRSLAWHVEGCVKRYGAHSDQPCECERRAAAAMGRAAQPAAGVE